MLLFERNIFVINVIFLNRNVNKYEIEIFILMDNKIWRFNDETKQKGD